MDKAHILREIKRTADANGGIPLGTARFATETGIKQSDWFGIHWPRWSDAQREAGFEPNQLTESYDIKKLLEQYAKLVLELGRLPTSSDLRFQANKVPSFPSHTTFARVGSKAELVAQLLEYCQIKEGYEEVVRLCAAYSPRKKQEEPEPAAPTEGEVTMGYVYLIKMGKYHKVGMTNSVGRRGYELDLQLPERTELVHYIATDDPPGIEAYWHNRFAAKNTNGEWFALDAADIAAFKRRKFM